MVQKSDLSPPFGGLSDEEYIQYLFSKENPTDEDVESAFRLEHLIYDYSALLEHIHRLAEVGLRYRTNDTTLKRIKELTASCSNCALDPPASFQ